MTSFYTYIPLLIIGISFVNETVSMLELGTWTWKENGTDY